MTLWLSNGPTVSTAEGEKGSQGVEIIYSNPGLSNLARLRVHQLQQTWAQPHLSGLCFFKTTHDVYVFTLRHSDSHWAIKKEKDENDLERLLWSFLINLVYAKVQWKKYTFDWNFKQNKVIIHTEYFHVKLK